MKKVYLMRHGRPVPKEENRDKPLSAQGKLDLERFAKFIHSCGMNVEEAFHSGKTRARETAEIILSYINPGLAPMKKKGLSPLDDVRDIAGFLKEVKKDILITGHLPHLVKLASLLITGDESFPVANFKEGSILCLEKREGGGWTIDWMLGPDII